MGGNFALFFVFFFHISIFFFTKPDGLQQTFKQQFFVTFFGGRCAHNFLSWS